MGVSVGMFGSLLKAAAKLIKKVADALDTETYDKIWNAHDQSINYQLDKERAARFNARPPAPISNTPDHPQLIFAEKKPLEKDREHFTVSGYKKDVDMTTVTIPDYVNILGQKCLRKCGGLQEVYIPDSVEMIEGEVFCECIKLNKVRLPPGIITIPFWCFRECRSLKTIVLPDSVKKIGFCAFFGSGLVEIVLPEGVDRIELSAFSLCYDLASITLPQSLTEIEGHAFESTKALSQIVLPEGLLSLGERTFWHSGLELINIPPKLTDIKHRTFRECNKLRSIYIPDNIKLIESEAFMGCESLQNVRIPYGVKIDETVFEGCAALGSFTVGDITADTSQAVPDVNAGILTEFIANAVNSGKFRPEPLVKKKVNDLFVIDIAFQLENYGIIGADSYVNRNLNYSLSCMAELGRSAAFDELVKRGGRLTPEQTDDHIAKAIETEQHELYLSLLRYKRDILGFDEGGDSGDRFEL